MLEEYIEKLKPFVIELFKNVFHKRGRFGLEKVQNSEIHVKVVLDMEYGNI